MGPSHRFYLSGVALTSATHMSTPLGDIPVDVEAVDALSSSNKEFVWMTQNACEEEHCIEMHLPFVAQHWVCSGHAVSVVPLVVGDLDVDGQAKLATAIQPLLADGRTLLAISTDFCHWGSRFRYTPYDSRHGAIWESIAAMDEAGMAAFSSGDPRVWEEYLAATGNTICGRTSMGVALRTRLFRPFGVSWLQYKQSSRVTSREQSSVSYAAGVLTAMDVPAGHSDSHTRDS
jgi:hypothetical protein